MDHGKAVRVDNPSKARQFDTVDFDDEGVGHTSILREQITAADGGRIKDALLGVAH
jgi:hypothetical protein